MNACIKAARSAKGPSRTAKWFARGTAGNGTQDGPAEGHPDQKLKTYPMKVENGEVFIEI